MSNGNKYPIITSDIIDLVDTMRQAQIHRDGMINNRDVHYGAHQVRRAEQAAHVAEKRVDEWTAQYRKEVKLYTEMMARYSPDGQGSLFGERSNDEG